MLICVTTIYICQWLPQNESKYGCNNTLVYEGGLQYSWIHVSALFSQFPFQIEIKAITVNQICLNIKLLQFENGPLKWELDTVKIVYSVHLQLLTVLGSVNANHKVAPKTHECTGPIIQALALL